MSDLPERFWVWRNEPGNEVVISVLGQPYPTGSPEYIRKDIADAAVKAERERCAKVAETCPFSTPWVAAPYPQGGTAMTIVRVPGWGLSITEARYYGYRWGAHVGLWLVFFGHAEGRG